MTTESQQHLLPEDPDSPIPGWKHYAIFKIIEQEAQKFLQDIEYDGHLVGLRVGYIVFSGDESQEYSMEFGNVVGDTNNNMEDDVPEVAERAHPLIEKNIDELYDQAYNLIKANLASDVDFSVILEAAVNRTIIYAGKVCRVVRAGECNNPTHVDRRFYLRLTNFGQWRCTHESC